MVGQFEKTNRLSQPDASRVKAHLSDNRVSRDLSAGHPRKSYDTQLANSQECPEQHRQPR
jgi:hypothetical protein